LRRNCRLKHIIQEKIDSKGRGGRRRRLLLNDLKKKRRYMNFKEETLILIIKRDALISQIYFWNRILHVSGRFSVHHEESSIVYTAISIAGSGWNSVPS